MKQYTNKNKYDLTENSIKRGIKFVKFKDGIKKKVKKQVKR